MPLSNHALPNILDYWFGDTAPTIPGIYYFGLVLELGELSTALTAGTAATSLACATATAAYSGADEDIILIGTTSTAWQTVQANGSWSASATSITVDSFVPNYSYPIGTPFIRCDAYATAQEPSGGAYARPSLTNNTTNFPATTESDPYAGWQKLIATAVTFAQATASWGKVAGFLIGDNATPGSGNIFVWGVINGAQTISTNNVPTFPANSLTIAAM
jgi:hypothetical protein